MRTTLPIHGRLVCGGRVLAMALLLFSSQGCTGPANDKTSDGRIIVQYWEKWTGFEAEAMQAVVNDFNASQDRIFVKMLATSQIDQKLLLATAGGNPPDVSGFWSHLLNVFAEKSALMPLDRHLEKAGITSDDYIPIYWKLCEHRGFMWGLPATPASMALHWNKKMFREAGLDPEKPPRSLAELDDLAEKLTVAEVMRDGRKQRVPFPELTEKEKKSGNFTLVQAGHLPSEPGWWRQMWGYWFGGDLVDGDEGITADSPENIEAFEWFQGYTKKYGLDNVRKFGASFGNFSSPQNPFLAGRIAMVLQGVWMYNFIDKYAPNLEWGAAPFPAKDPDRWPNVTITECDMLVIPRGARHPEEAFEFIRYVNTQGPMEKLCLGQRKYSPLAQVSPEFIRLHPNPYIQTFLDLARSPNAKTVPRISVWTEYRTEMEVAADKVFTLLATPAEALTEVQNRVQWKLDRVNRRWDLVQNERLQQWREYNNW